jgi:hypothetical protein
MSEFQLDDDEVRALAIDLGRIADQAVPKVRPIVRKGAVNIKNELRTNLGRSRSFKGVTPAVSFDTRESPSGIEAEIGPRKGKPGSLANVAFFGTSRGGGTVPDPQEALDAEEPRFLKALGGLIDGEL